MVGCFVLGIVFIIAVVFVSDYHFSPWRGRLPAVGPRVPMPNVDAATLAAGQRVYQGEDCGACHVLTGANSQDGRHGAPSDRKARFAPDLTHEGRRNASIDWQIDNLRDHHRLVPNSMMPDYNDLSPTELRALASYLATRR